MKAIKSVFARVLVLVILIMGLTAVSCNQRSGEVRDTENRNENEDVRMRERQDNDSVDVMRDQGMGEGERGYGDPVDNTGQEGREGTNTDRSRDMDSRGTNQGNDTEGGAGSERR